uniref:Dihydropteroate synthase n=1 Tax=candidate division WOR-3 bacterium TaxID=2052148 RepID=A0A7V3ZZE4_UNCW3
MVDKLKVNFGDHTLIMGILNVTPDSFYDGGKYNLTDSALKRAEEILREGADIIDIGGESSRPGADPVTLQEELDRVIPVIEKLKGFPIPISIDTYKSQVAEEACKNGASIINDISGLTQDERMVEVAKKYGTYIIIMHMKGTPKNMQINPTYTNVIEEIKEFLQRQANYAMKRGISRDRIIIDPGIGFGKNLEHNLEILKKIDEFKKMGFPLLVGHSRKSMVGILLGNVPPDERLYGTLGISAYLIFKGVNIIRVHDVKPHVELRKVVEALK